MAAYDRIIDGIITLLRGHKARHENNGGDEISITGLSGVPSVLNNIITYEDLVVSKEGDVVTNE